MKKLFTLLVSLLLVFSLSACTNYAENTLTADGSNSGLSMDNIFMMDHLSGERAVTEQPVYVLFEFETLKYTKYQIAYLSCT